uniref:SIS domain-containing protein n=1 Tax=Herbidospora sakaeratensis TaxID=564415 RepID=UPI000783FBE7|nr:SIS domain-containing protein [Herbidospora sakaeratensis]
MSTVDQSAIGNIIERLSSSAAALNRTRAGATHILSAAEQIVRTFRANGKLITVGNGGSAVQAQHLAAECVGRYSAERNGLPAIALSADSAAVTAISNDFGFDLVFARQVETLGESVDTLVAFSTSGRSPNVIRSVEAAKKRGMATILLTGPNPEAGPAADVVIAIPAASTALVQECHLAVVHLLVELVESTMFGREKPHVTPKIATMAELLPLREGWRRAALTLVWTNGCFDLLHAGHVRSLAEARAHGDILVVGLNSDESVRRLKGSSRPIYPLEHRQEILAALSSVDHVVTMDGDDPRTALESLRPDVHFKGGDYHDASGLVEKPTTDRIGARVVLGRHWAEHATSGTIDTIVGRHALM